MATDYLDSLPEEAYNEVVTTLQDISKDSDLVDAVLLEAPKAPQLRVYKYYKTDPSYAEGGLLTEPGYLVASTTKPADKSGATIFEINIPAGGVPTLQLESGGDNGDVYMFGYGLTLYYFPEEDGTVPATIAEAFAPTQTELDALTASGPGIKFNTGYIPTQEIIETFPGESLEEFYNHAHGKGGKFAPSAGGGGSRGGGGQGNRQGQQNQGGQRHGGGGGQHQGNRPQGGVSPNYKGNHPGGRPPFKEKTKLQKISTISRDVAGVLAAVTVAITLYNFYDKQQNKKGYVQPYKALNKNELASHKGAVKGMNWLGGNKLNPINAVRKNGPLANRRAGKLAKAAANKGAPRGYMIQGGKIVRDPSQGTAKEVLKTINKVNNPWDHGPAVPPGVQKLRDLLGAQNSRKNNPA